MFVMISEKLRRELEVEVSVWVKATGPENDIVDTFITKMLVEYEANKKGFTQYKESASYPIV